MFPPLDIAERGIDLDMENLFRTAGAASDPADIDFDGGSPDAAAEAGSTIALPQACFSVAAHVCTEAGAMGRRAGLDCLLASMYGWSRLEVANVG